MTASPDLQVKAPDTYQEWLDCLKLLKNSRANGSDIYRALVSGTFSGTDVTKAALQNQIVDAVNAFLTLSARRFVRSMNDCISFNEMSQMELLFHRLKKDIDVALFFEQLDFLPPNYRAELSESVKKQMSSFWDNTVRFLNEQLLEFNSSDLEDALFLIQRIKLFHLHG